MPEPSQGFKYLPIGTCHMHGLTLTTLLWPSNGSKTKVGTGKKNRVFFSSQPLPDMWMPQPDKCMTSRMAARMRRANFYAWFTQISKCSWFFLHFALLIERTSLPKMQNHLLIEHLRMTKPLNWQLSPITILRCCLFTEKGLQSGLGGIRNVPCF